MGPADDHGPVFHLAAHGQIRPVSLRIAHVPCPDHGRKRPRLLAIAAVWLWSASAVHADRYHLPNLGEASSVVLSRSQERILGAQFMREARQQLPIIHDPELETYLQSFGEHLVHASDEPKARFTFFLIHNRVINAFSVPGAYVGVDSGLVLTTRNEDELAAVLSHEIAHVTQHHIARLLAEQQRLSLPSMGAMLAGILLAAAQPMAGIAMLTTTSAALAQNQLDYSRRFEAEADRVGQATLVRAGFNPRAMPDFFERLERWAHLNDAGALPPFLQTHPVTAERIAQSRDRAAAYPDTAMKDGLHFELMRARLRVMTARSARAVAARYRRALLHASQPRRQAYEYGLALADLRRGQLAQATERTQALRHAHPARLAYALLRAEIDEAAGHYSAAAIRYHHALVRHPGSIAAEEHYAMVLLQSGNGGDARTTLQHLTHAHPDHAYWFRLLARANTETGHPLAAHQALARYYDLDDQPEAAIEQLHLAATLAGQRHDSYTLALLSARIAHIRRRVKDTPKLP